MTLVTPANTAIQSAVKPQLLCIMQGGAANHAAGPAELACGEVRALTVSLFLSGCPGCQA